jgi:DNA-binding response OmpR family regulator
MTAATNILLLDSEPLLREATAIMLRRSGGRVRVAASIDEAITAARGGRFDVAVLDVPVGAGRAARDALDALREAGCEPPRVVVCAAREDAASASGPSTELVPKPFPFARLVRAIFGGAARRDGPSARARRVPTPRRRTPRASPDRARRIAAAR